MKRANQLQPLSRQHHLGLHIGRHAKMCTDTPESIAEHWQALSTYISDMQSHFNLEDDLITHALLPYRSSQPEIGTALDTLEQQHELIRSLTAEIQAIQQDKNKTVTVHQVRQLGELLYEHVRFEERELFPIVEKYLTEDELNAIYAASDDDIKRLDELR